MTAAEALRRARQRLAARKIDDAALEAELLLRHTLKKSRAELYLELNKALSPEETATFWQLIARRLNHEPTAYITGHREFYGLDLYLDRRVLIPRPESELLVEKALAWAASRGDEPVLVAEIGTGSGAIAIALARHLPQAQLYATDISAGALKVAALNCQRHHVTYRIRLLEGDLLAALNEPVDLIVANLPYLTDREMETLPPEIRDYEPGLALAGGEAGLDRIRASGNQAARWLRPGGSLLLEIGKGQAKTVTALLKGYFPPATVEIIPDLSGTERVVSLTLPR